MPAPLLPLIPYAAAGYCAALVATKLKLFPTPRSNPSGPSGPSTPPGFDGEQYDPRASSQYEVCGGGGRPGTITAAWQTPTDPGGVPTHRNYQQYGVRMSTCGGEPASGPVPRGTPDMQIPQFTRGCVPTGPHGGPKDLVANPRIAYSQYFSGAPVRRKSTGLSSMLPPFQRRTLGGIRRR
jgi:hypothetical protein